jgi:hypothetical protein
MMAGYEEMAPAADKWLHADGSVSTLAGEGILPADQNRAEDFASRAPIAAKWLMPDGDVAGALPFSTVGAVITGEAAPDDSIGKLGDFYVTPDGIYVKKMVESGGGFILSGASDMFDGLWRDMGVNEVMSSYGGDPQGTHYYQHADGQYYLCWNTAYSGYWWINTQLDFDNGSATAYCSTPEFTGAPPGSGWNGAFSVNVTWTPDEPAAIHPGWELCFNFKTRNGLPYYKVSRLMKHSEGVSKVQGSNGLSMYLTPDSATGGLLLYAYLSLASGGNMARIDSSNLLYVGESLYGTYSPTGATQALALTSYRNFKVSLSAAAITLSFSGSLQTGSYPHTVKVWMIPKSTATGTPKHTVTWPASVKWASVNDHRCIGAAGQADTPVLCELTTFDSGTTWIGRAFNVLSPDKEAANV